MFKEIAQNGIERIWKEDKESQVNFLNIIAETSRNMNPDILFKYNCFFVPNNNYMIHFFGQSITDFEYDCYTSSGECVWENSLVFPIYNVSEEVVGFVGYNAINKEASKEDEEMKGAVVYRDSNSNVFDKSRYIFSLKGMYRKAIEEGYIVITDGVFDTVSFTANGINAGAFLGSYVSDALIAFLRFVKVVYVSMDNDDAGKDLVKKLKKRLNNVRAITQDKFKDIDELLKSPYKDDFLQQFEKNRKLGIKLDFNYKVKRTFGERLQDAEEHRK